MCLTLCMLDKLLRWKRSAYSDSCKDSNQSSRLSDVFLPSKNMERGFFFKNDWLFCPECVQFQLCYLLFTKAISYFTLILVYQNPHPNKAFTVIKFILYHLTCNMSTIIWYVNIIWNPHDRKLLQTCLNLELNSKYKWWNRDSLGLFHIKVLLTAVEKVLNFTWVFVQFLYV